jgi:hypothetical protein
MATRSEQLARLELLEKMRDSGVSSTSVDGVQTSFRSLNELNQSILILKRTLGQVRRKPRNMSVYMGHR